MKRMGGRGIIFFFLFLISISSVFGVEKKSAIQIYNKAREYENQENWYSASQYYMEVVEINPAYSDAWLRLADCTFKLGEYDLAASYLENAEKYEKNNSEVKNLKGMILLALGKNKEAKELFLQILETYPNDVNAHFGLAEIELYNGKFSGAETQYVEALKRQNTNRKALLSLAVVCAETGRFSQADKYLNQAMQYYSGEPEVHYLAAIVYFMQKNFVEAEKHARISVEINSNYTKAYDLLAQVIYFQKRYNEVIDLCDFLISKNRNNYSAWYLKGIAQEKLGLCDEAIDTWSTGLTIYPQDEIMRMAMETEVRKNLSIEENRRKNWSEYHLNNAKQYETRFDKAGAVYEYQRALLINPLNVQARLSYADTLKMNGMHELYLDQLKFVQDNTQTDFSTDLKDTIEAYNSLLTNTLAKKWDVDPFYLDKIRWNIAVFYEDSSSSFNHADINKIAAVSCADIFSGVAITSVKTQVTPVNGYGEAFANARVNKFDYFVIVSMSEGDEDITLKSTLYSGRTGTEISNNTFYATGNNRYSTVLRRFRASVLEKLTVRGKILNRNGKTVLIDLGKSENIVKDAEFKIIKKGCVKTADKGTGLFYKDSDVLGTLTVTNVGEEISEATITNHGFYDRINIDDELVLIAEPKQDSQAVIDNVPNSDEKGNKLVNNDVKGEELVSEIKKAVEKPAIVELLRDIF